MIWFKVTMAGLPYILPSFQHFTRIHYTSRIEQLLDLLHPSNAHSTLGVMKGMSFHSTNAMFGGHGTPM